jgi:hypothetical protein
MTIGDEGRIGAEFELDGATGALSGLLLGH